MADNTQAALDVLIAHQAITHPNTFVGTPVSVAGNLEATATLWIARVETVVPVEITAKIQATAETPGNEKWQDLIKWRTNLVAADTEALTNTEIATATVIRVAATAGFAVDQYCYIQDTGTLVDSEWVEVQQIVTNTSIDILDGLTNQKDNADIIFNEAERFKLNFLCGGWRRVRAVIINEAATGPNIHVMADLQRVTDFV